LNEKKKAEVYNSFMSAKEGIIVYTCAFGTGVDCKDVKFCYHYGSLQSILEYAQESGRARRDGCKAMCKIFWNQSFISKIDYMVKSKTDDRIVLDNLEKMIGYVKVHVQVYYFSTDITTNTKFLLFILRQDK
jgi:ATP-dependent DNA helicase RecQ